MTAAPRINAAAEIKSRLTMAQVAVFYGFTPNRAGFIRCPFHAEKTASCKLYGGQRGYYCHACHVGGDAIDFVKRLFDIPFKDALAKLNADFALGLSFDRPNRAEMSRLLRERQAEARRREEAELICLGLHDLDVKLSVALSDCEKVMKENPPTLKGDAANVPEKYIRSMTRRNALMNYGDYYWALERRFKETGGFPPEVTPPMIRHFIRRGINIQYRCGGGKTPSWLTEKETRKLLGLG